MRLRPDQVEDAVQAAFEALARRDEPLESAEAFARVVIRNAVVNRRRTERRRGVDLLEQTLLEGLPSPADGFPSRLDEVEHWLHLDAAFQQLILFDHQKPRGRTLAVISSLDEVDLEWYRLIARYFFQVVDELPRRERQKQRLREDLVRGLRSALDRSGYVLRELSEEERGAGDLWELRVGWAEGDPLDARRDGKLVPAIVLRGMMLAQRLCRGLSNEEALAAAERADHLVLSTGKRRRDDPGDGPGEHTFGYDHWDDESRVSPGEEVELARELGWLQLDPGAPYLVLSAQTERRPTIRIYPDGDHLWGEASGNRELAPEHRLKREAIARLVAMGWQRPRRRNPSFERRWSAATDGERLTVAADLRRTFEVYGAKGADLEVVKVELVES